MTTRERARAAIEKRMGVWFTPAEVAETADELMRDLEAAEVFPARTTNGRDPEKHAAYMAEYMKRRRREGKALRASVGDDAAIDRAREQSAPAGR